MQKEKQIVEALLGDTGITLNGSNPCDPQIHNDNFYRRVLQQGSLGLGESYMDGWWDCEALDQFFHKIITAGLDKKVQSDWGTAFKIAQYSLFSYGGWKMAIARLKKHLINHQTRTGSKKVAKEHYDLSPQLYESFLDPYNQYTCGYFKDTDSLNVAQEQKLDLICRKLQLSAKDRVLDIGCGWGGFSKYAAEHYGCHVIGITLSEEQAKYAREYTRGLPVEIKIVDYRDLSEKYDKILVCGMLEHVGSKNYRELMKIAHDSLKDDGLFLLHTIGGNLPKSAMEPWTSKYIFPNTQLPSLSQISKATEGLFVPEDVHNFGAYYGATLMAWHKNFVANWNNIKQNYDDRFYRMWRYYLLSCAGMFRARDAQLYQVVLSKKGVPGGCETIR